MCMATQTAMTQIKLAQFKLTKCLDSKTCQVAVFYILIHIQVHFRLDFIMEANIMKPDQTAPLGAV